MGRPIKALFPSGTNKPKLIKVEFGGASYREATINLTTAMLHVPTPHGVYGSPYVYDGPTRINLDVAQFRKVILDGGATIVVPSAGIGPRMIIHTDHAEYKFGAIVMQPVMLD